MGQTLTSGCALDAGGGTGEVSKDVQCQGPATDLCLRLPNSGGFVRMKIVFPATDTAAFPARHFLFQSIC